MTTNENDTKNLTFTPIMVTDTENKHFFIKIGVT